MIESAVRSRAYPAHPGCSDALGNRHTRQDRVAHDDKGQPITPWCELGVYRSTSRILKHEVGGAQLGTRIWQSAFILRHVSELDRIKDVDSYVARCRDLPGDRSVS